MVSALNLELAERKCTKYLLNQSLRKYSKMECETENSILIQLHDCLWCDESCVVASRSYTLYSGYEGSCLYTGGYYVSMEIAKSTQ